MRLYLVRHGEAYVAPDGLYPHGGWLTRRGHAQARALVPALKALRIGRVITSGMRRAFETARPFARASGLEIEAAPGLNEISIGQLRDAPLETVRSRLTSTPPFSVDFSDFGGEDAFGFQRRVLDALRRVVLDQRQPDERIAAVIHGGPIGLILDHAEGRPFDGILHREIPNASISLVRVCKDSLTIKYSADVRHLDPAIQSPGTTARHGEQ